jgi:diguanylate cyclase (GGDEF)-like protein
MPESTEPGATARAARILLSGLKSPALAVCEQGRPIGLVTAESLSRAPDLAHVGDFITPLGPAIDAETPVRAVAKTFLAEQVDFAAVVSQGRYVGLVTARDLLSEMSRSHDPLTNLSWQDFLREWGLENLMNGHEVTIIFIDLDDFGQYNKRYGHVVGDRVIQSVASLLSASLDPDRDILVRYAGDEFAIGTLRLRNEAEVFADLLERRQAEAIVEDFTEPVTFSAGVFGGKRTKEREDSHFQSTLDNLITLASKAALARKQSKKRRSDPAPVEPPSATSPVLETPEPEERFAPSENEAEAQVAPAAPVAITEVNGKAEIVEVLVDEAAPNSLTTVILGMQGSLVNGVSARMGGSVSHSVAMATAKALERAYPGVTAQVQDVRLGNAADGKPTVAVFLQRTDASGNTRNQVAQIVAKSLESVYLTVAEATRAAFYAIG